MAQSNFQDVVILNQRSLTLGVEVFIVGTDAGSKSIVFAQDPAQASALFLVASAGTEESLGNINGGAGTSGVVIIYEYA